MRNSWYPHQKAEYIATISDVDPRTVVAERDFAFGVQDLKGKKAPESSYDPVTLGPVPKAKTQLLTVGHTSQVQSKSLICFCSLKWQRISSRSSSHPALSFTAQLLLRRRQKNNPWELPSLDREEPQVRPHRKHMLLQSQFLWIKRRHHLLSCKQYLVQYPQQMWRTPSRLCWRRTKTVGGLS